MPQTRGVFALIMAQNAVLLSERADGKGWNLPGGGFDPKDEAEAKRRYGEKATQTDIDWVTLTREVREETGLEIEVLEQIGEPLIFGEDTAVAYACKVVAGHLVPTKEAKQHRFCSKEDLSPVTATLKLVGPEGRLGRTGRMVWDGLSLMEEPQIGPKEAQQFLPGEGVFVSDDRCFLYSVIDATVDGQKKWPRLDPYSPTGKMEPKK